MTIEPDFWIDRRRLKRSLTFWRIMAIVALVVAAIVAVGRIEPVVTGGHVARIAVSGLLVHDPDRDQALLDLARDRQAKAVIVRIDSPGGTVVGGETLFRRLREVAAAKPVVAVMGELATSAAYMTALASDHIVAHEGTITGSIGVIVQTTDITALLDKIGIRPEAVKSGPLKAQPNPLEPMSPEAREVTRAVVLDMHEMFIDLVAERRGLAKETVRPLADGRIFTGRQALAAGLIDGVGGEREARSWLAEVHGIDPGLAVRDVDIERPSRLWRQLVTGGLGKIVFSERLSIDGLVSVWHPEL